MPFFIKRSHTVESDLTCVEGDIRVPVNIFHLNSDLSELYSCEKNPKI